MESSKKKMPGTAEGKEVIKVWSQLSDKARYLKSEHDLKEKEYGIPWRTAYKQAIITAVADLEKQKLCNERVGSSEQAFEVIALSARNAKTETEKLYLKEHQDQAKEFRQKFTLFEQNILFLKKLLKEQDVSKFESIRKETIA